MSDVKPAMSPEEWERAFDDGLAGEADGGWTDNSNARARLVEITAHHRRFHCAAALALHGQPYGFTSNEPAFLRTICLSGQYEEHEAKAVHEALALIADRIEALLPPREEP